jgi:hypothetical protein
VWLLCYLWTNPGKLGWWVAPTLNQSMGDGYQTFVEIDQKAKDRGEPGFIRKAIESKRRIYLLNRSRIEFRSWEKKEYLRGRTVHAMVVDEAGLLDATSRAILSTRRSATLGPIRYIGNPGPTLGEFWNLCQQADDEENVGRMRLFRWTWSDRYHALNGDHARGDTPASLLDVAGAAEYLAYVESQRKDLSPFLFDENYEGKFASPPGAIFASWLNAAMVLEPDPQPHEGHGYIVGWDIGQENDWTRGAFLCIECWKVHHVASIRHRPYPEIEEFIASETRRFNEATAVIETNGPGKPVFDAVLQKYKNAQKWFTDGTNKRSAVLMVNRLGSGGELQLADIPVLRQEMSMFSSKQSRTTGAWSFESPKGGHDDAVMALVIAVGAATSGASGYLLMMEKQIAKAHEARLKAQEQGAGSSVN